MDASPSRVAPAQVTAGPFAADIASFRLHLAAENKAAGTIRTYTDAARWFAAAHLLSFAIGSEPRGGC